MDDLFCNEGFIYFFCVMNYVDMQWFKMIKMIWQRENQNHSILLKFSIVRFLSIFLTQGVCLILKYSIDEHLSVLQEAFTKAFVKHYSRISLVLVKGLKRTEIGNRVVHISVQLFSNEGLACQMVQEYNLLYTLIISLTHMIENTLLESSLEGESYRKLHS